MKCPHCSISFHDNWDGDSIYRHGSSTGWYYRTAKCPSCNNLTIEIQNYAGGGGYEQVFPRGSNRGPISPHVPAQIAQDYQEACSVLSISAKASAALARRCMQSVLHHQGYKARDLAKEIDLVLTETDPNKVIPASLRDIIDGVRNFGNFSAHPITDQTSLQVIDVEPHEAEWCLDIIEEMFDHYYVQPAVRAARKAALNAKLVSAGKPVAK